MAIGNRIHWIAYVAGFSRGRRLAPTQQAIALQIQAGQSRLPRRKAAVVLPCVGARLKARRVFQVETRLVLQVVRKKLRFNPRAKLCADGFTIIQVAQMACRTIPIPVPPRPKHQEILVSRVVRLQPRVYLLRSIHVFLVVIPAHTQRRHSHCIQRLLHAARTPVAVICRMVEEQLPRRKNFRPRFLHIRGK